MVWVWSDSIVSSVLILDIRCRDLLLSFEISRVTYEFITVVPSMTPHVAIVALHCIALKQASLVCPLKLQISQ